MMFTAPENTIIVFGHQGINELLAKVYHQWEIGGTFGIVWHLDRNHEPTASQCDCPKIIFRNSVSYKEESPYGTNGPVD